MKPVYIALASTLVLTACNSNKAPGSAPDNSTASAATNSVNAAPNSQEETTGGDDATTQENELSPAEKQVQDAVTASFDAERDAEGGDPDRMVSQDEMDERATLLRRCFGLVAYFFQGDAHPAIRQGPMTLAQVQLAYPAGHWTFSSAENAFAFHINGSDSLTGQNLKEDLQFEVNAKPTAACPNGVAYVRRVAVNNMLGNGRDALKIWNEIASAANSHRL